MKHQAEMGVLKGDYESAVKKKTDLESEHKRMSDQREKMEVWLDHKLGANFVGRLCGNNKSSERPNFKSKVNVNIGFT